MALSKEAIGEIKQEADRLREKAQAFLTKAAALEEIVAEYDGRTATTSQSEGKPAPTASLGKMGFRESIRHVLAQHADGLRPFMLAEQIEAAGFKYGGKAPFKAVVSSEVARMRKAHLLTKTSGGKYRLPEVSQVS